MRSANLLNDFAFKYVFGQDQKDANDALKGLLSIIFERQVMQVVVKNSELFKNVEDMKDPRLDLTVEFDDRYIIDLEMQLKQTKDDLSARFEYYLARLHAQQDLEGKYYKESKTSMVLVFLNVNLYNNTSSYFHSFQFRNEQGELFSKEDDKMKIFIIEMKKLNQNKNIGEMSDKEKLIYYFLNCQKGNDDSKMKAIIETNEVIRMIENRVNKISDDRWKQFHEKSVKLHMNEVAMEYRYEAEEAKRLAEKEKQKASEARKSLEQEKKNALEAKNKLEQEKQHALEAKNLLEQEKQHALEAKNLLEQEKQNALEAKNLLEQEKQKTSEAKKRLEQEKQHALEVKNLLEQEKQNTTKAKEKTAILIETLSKTMTQEDIAKLLNISVDELNTF